jgi:hypothetical protein
VDPEKLQPKDTAVRATCTLTFDCVDSAGNAEDRKARSRDCNPKIGADAMHRILRKKSVLKNYVTK